MINEVIFLQSIGFFRGGLSGDIFTQWEQAGVFSYLLPFLLIFAVIFGILTRTEIFKDHKAVNAIIALVVALMALQFEMVPQFFSEIFPRLGVGLAIILIALILAGMFSEKLSGIMYVVAGIIFIVILVNTAGVLGWTSAFFWSESWPELLIVAAIIAGIVAVIGYGSTPKPAQDPLSRALRGETT